MTDFWKFGLSLSAAIAVWMLCVTAGSGQTTFRPPGERSPPRGLGPGPGGPPPAAPPASQPAGHMGRHPFGERFSQPLTTEQIGKVLDFLKAEDPDLRAALEKLKNDDPARYQLRLERVGWATIYMIDLKSRDPQKYVLIMEEMKLGRKISQLASGILDVVSDPAKESQLRVALRDDLAKRFEVRIKRQQLEIDQLQQRVETLKKMLEIRLAQRESIIEQEVRQVLDNEARRRAQRQARAAGASAGDSAPPTAMGSLLAPPDDAPLPSRLPATQPK